MKDSKLKRLLLSYWDILSPAIRAHKIRKKYTLTIMTSEQTVAYVKKHNCSIARYGDGEFGLMLKTGGVGFQYVSDELSDALKNVFHNPSPDLLICLPHPMVSTRDFLPHGKKFWNEWSINCQKNIFAIVQHLTTNNYVFGDSFMSRPYTGYKSSKKAAKLFPLLKELWDGEDILFVEGEGTRMGIGNDLFDNAKSIKRILAPAENAFSVYPQILESVLSHWNGELVIIALGPTATVLASDLSKKGIQALDIGHIDVQYEWFQSGTPYQPIANKYVNEAIGGNSLVEYTDPVYESQIIDTIKAL